MPIDFTVTAQRLINELLPTAGGGKDNFFADSSIGAPMRCEWDVEVSGSLEDTTLVSLRGTKALINPALFLGSGPGPYPFSADTGYVVDVPVTATGSDEFVMSIWTGSPYEESNRNLSCILRYVDSNHATIILSFRMTMDMGGHIDGSEQQNHKRLTYSHKSSPNDGQAHGIGSVYRNTNRKLSGKITLTDLDGYSVTKDAETGAMSRWFLAGLPNDTDSPPDGELIGGEFNWWFDLLRGGVVVEDLSVYQETEVNLYLDYDGSYTIDDQFMVYVIDKTPGTNLDRYPIQLGSTGPIVTSAITNGQNIGGHVIGIATPIVTTTYDGFPARLLRFKVGVDLDPTHSYAILVVVPGAPTAGNTDNTVTNSFLINNLSANGLPAPLPMTSDDFSGTIVDYNADPGVDNVISTVVDFLTVKVRVNTATYNTLSDAALFGSTWNADLMTIRLRIEDEDGTDFGWARTFHKNPFGVFTSGVTLPDSNVIQIQDLGGGIIEYSLQVHGCYPNSAGWPDFSDHNVRLRWEFDMHYPFQSWIVRYQYDQRARFEGYKFFQEVIKEINLYDYDSGLPLTSLCQSDFVRVEVKLDTDLMLGYQWNIRAGWTLEPHGFNYNMQIRPAGLNAEQSYVGELPQLDTPTITALPAVFDGAGVATFVLDTSGIPLGQRARIHVIAEPIPGACAEPTIDVPLAVLDDCEEAQFAFDVVVSSTAFFDVLGIRYRVNGGSWVNDEGGAGYYFEGPFDFGDVVEVEVLNNVDPECNFNLGEIESACPPCTSYPAMPTFVDVDFECLSSDQATLEGSSLTVGWTFIIKDHPDATPIVTPTLFEQNTGNVAEWNGSGWDITVLAPGTVVNILALSASPDFDKYQAVRSASDDTTTYASGKFVMDWLLPPVSNDSDPSPFTRFLIHSINTGIAANTDGLSDCRQGEIEFGTVEWSSLGTYGEVLGSTIAGGSQDFDTTDARVGWYGGPLGEDFQGYSRVRTFL